MTAMPGREDDVVDANGRPRSKSATATATETPTSVGGGALVPIRQPKREQPEPLEGPRLSDVDEWGRSEKMRALARQVYRPIYERWFRAEWEGLENIPANGGAPLVAHH